MRNDNIMSLKFTGQWFIDIFVEMFKPALLVCKMILSVELRTKLLNSWFYNCIKRNPWYSHDTNRAGVKNQWFTHRKHKMQLQQGATHTSSKITYSVEVQCHMLLISKQDQTNITSAMGQWCALSMLVFIANFVGKCMKIKLKEVNQGRTLQT